MCRVFHFRPRQEVLHCLVDGWNTLVVVNSNFALCQLGAICRLNLPRNPWIALFSGTLDVAAIEPEMKPVFAAPLEN